MRGETGRKGHPWVRWLLLMVAGLYGWNIWRQAREYALLLEREIFSPAELAEIGSSYYFTWTLRGLVILGLLFVFFTWRLNRKTWRGALTDGVFLAVLALLWAPVPCALSMAGLEVAIWVGVLLALAGGAAWSCWKVCKYRRVEQLAGGEKPE